MEHFLYDENQKLLNEYNESPSTAPLPRSYLADKGRQGRGGDIGWNLKSGYTFTEVIEAAHKAGIRLVALDNQNGNIYFQW